MRHLAFLFAGLTALACTDAPAGDKPASDPDQAVLSGKADGVTRYLTDIRGELPIGSRVTESIDYPSFYFGRTATLHAGQRLQVDLVTNRKSLVRVYRSNGQLDGVPTFGAPLVKADTRKVHGQQTSSFAFDVPADGVYMLVYGPQNVWAANYQIDVTCLGGCAAVAACEGDWDCQANEFCGDNGVRCVRAPCDANFNVCQARHDVGASCTRDAECGAGAACRNDVCVVETCATEDDCRDGFCGCADTQCSAHICKDYAAEGESCGGFRMADRVRFCSSEFECVAPYDIIADIPGHCGDMTTVATILADPKAFDGHFVAIKGVFDPNAPFCTKIGCSDANPCCNQCSASMRVYDDASQFGTEGIYLSEEGATLGCTGNECTVTDSCGATRGNYWVAGWFRFDGAASGRIEIVARYPYGN